ncbi:MAG TPA: LolA-related protein [Burkholderiaceae bacterium]|nr:LolA-related protein [Burkholderiaceae bacterium]
MTERRAVLCVLAGALLSSTAPARAGGDDLEGLFALFAAQGERRKAFVERRYSVLFRNPPEARGTLYFKPPALLERDVVSPRKEKVRIDAETATLRIEGDDGKVTERKASLATIPQLANLVLTIRATLAGDLATLRRNYVVTMTHPLPRWRIEMTPIMKIDEAAGGGVSTISMAGERAEVERIEFTDTSGDRTEILLSPAS